MSAHKHQKPYPTSPCTHAINSHTATPPHYSTHSMPTVSSIDELACSHFLISPKANSIGFKSGLYALQTTLVSTQRHPGSKLAYGSAISVAPLASTLVRSVDRSCVRALSQITMSPLPMWSMQTGPISSSKRALSNVPLVCLSEPATQQKSGNQ